ncbi:MAG TPA: helix-turn-helix domain-containing protein [Spirochaetia bacterium]
MGKSKELEHPHVDGEMSPFCGLFASLMDLLGRRWAAVILRALLGGPRRFNEILAAIPGLSDPLLTQRLREMEAHKLLVRHVYPTSPVRVEYELTEAGRDLEPAVRALSAWAEKWLPAAGEPAREHATH